MRELDLCRSLIGLLHQRATYKRTPALPQPAPLRFREMLLDSRKQRQMVDYLARLQRLLRSNLRKLFILTDQTSSPSTEVARSIFETSTTSFHLTT